jgi:Uncharacterized protein conserved in bacteria
MNLDFVPVGLFPAFSVKAAKALGMTRRALRRCGLAIPFHGVRSAEDATFKDRLRALLDQTPKHSFASGITAAAVHGLPLPTTISSRDAFCQPNIGVKRGKPRVRRKHVTASQLTIRMGDIVLADDIRVTSLFRTWLDLSRTSKPWDFLALTDALISHKAPRISLTDLRAYSALHEGTAGARLRAQALRWADPGSESPMESITRWHLLNKGAPRPECNTTITLPGGQVYRPDMLFRPANVITEYNGTHHDLPEHEEYDHVRGNLLDAAGFTIFVVNRSHISRLSDVAKEIVDHVTRGPTRILAEGTTFLPLQSPNT